MPDDGIEQRKLAAIMFTDMVGYSALSQRNESLAIELLEEHRGLVRGILRQFDGREIQVIGDAFMVEFSSAVEAVRCAIEIQRILHERNARFVPARQFQLRIGLHVGDVVHRDGEVLGDGVNIAARIEPLAEPGGICISIDMVRHVQRHLEVKIISLGPAQLKNIEVPIEVCRIVLPWEAWPASSQSMTQPARRKVLMAALSGCLILLAAAVFFMAHPGQDKGARSSFPTNAVTRPPASPRIFRSIAVKPLDYISGDTNRAYLADGMTEKLIDYLGRISALNVRSRSSVMRYKGGAVPISQMAKDLNVEVVLEGSLQAEGERLLITLQLIEAANDNHLWSMDYDRTLGDFINLQKDVAQVVAAQVQAVLTPEEKVVLGTRTRQLKPDAVENFLRGNFYASQGTEAGLRTSIKLFEKAATLETNYSEAYVALADSYRNLANVYVAPKEVMPLALSNVLIALKLDLSLPEAHNARGNIYDQYEFKPRKHIEAMQTAIRLNPNFARAHMGMALGFLNYDRRKEAFAEAEIALKLDPLSAGMRIGAQWLYFFSRDYDSVIREGSRALELQENNAMAHGLIGLAYVQKGDKRRAIQELEPACKMQDHPDMVLAFLAYAYALAGQKEDARAKLRELEEIASKKFICTYEIATGYVALGEFDPAFKWLYLALQAKSYCIPHTEVDPRLDGLRSDPRYKQFVKDIGFEK